MTTTLVTLTGDVTDAIGTDFDARRTKAYVRHNTAKIVTDGDEPIHLGGGTVNVGDDGTFTLPNVVAATSLVENLQATVYIDYADPATRQRATATFGPYDLSAETGTVDIRDLEEAQALDPSFASDFMAQAQELLAAQIAISGIDDTDSAVAALIEDALIGPLTRAALSASIEAEVTTLGTPTNDGVRDTISALQRAVLRLDPALKANGAITAGDVLDTGQTVDANMGAKPMKYVSGQIVHDPGVTVGATSAGYLQLKVPSGTVRQMQAEVAWDLNSLGIAAFVVPSAQWITGIGTLPVAGVHFSFPGNGVFAGGVYNPADGSVGSADADRLDLNSGTAVTLQATTGTGAQSTASLTISTMTAATLKAALEGLSNIGAGKVNVVGPFAGKFGIVWDNSLGGVALAVTASAGTPAPATTEYVKGGVTNYATYTTHGRYASVWDSQERVLGMSIDPDTAELIIFYPDGTNSGVITDPAIHLWTSEYAIFELQENNIGTITVPARFGEVAVGNTPAYTDYFYASKTDVIRQLAASKPVTLCDQANTTGSDVAVSGSIPPGTAWLEVIVIGGSGGGGGGGCQVSGTSANGGGAGGSAGIIREVIPASALGSSWSGTIGHKGVGGASRSTAGVGNNGTTGTLSKMSCGGVAYQALAGGAGVGGGTGTGVGTGGGAGGPFATAGTASAQNGAIGAAGGGITANLGVPGSGSGGGVTTTPTATNGGAGGSNLVRGFTGGTGGIVGGASPGRGTDITSTAVTTAVAGVPGPGVGGGAASSTGAAQAGATPVMYGVGGGGGGASLDTFASGAGGDGIGGYLLVRAHML